MRGGRTTAILVLFMIVLGMGLITVYYMYKTVSTVHNMISMPTWLAKEIGNKYVLVTQAFDLKPGQVYQVTATKDGWQITQKDTKLYDILSLKDVDLSLNDVITLHIYDLWFNGNAWAAIPITSDINVTDAPFSLAIGLSSSDLEEGYWYFPFTRPGCDTGFRIEPSLIIDFGLFNATPVAYFAINNSNVVPSTMSNYVGVFTGSEVKLFKDGYLVASKAFVGTPKGLTSSWFMGYTFDRSTAQYFIGRIAYAMIFARALTDDEVLNMRNGMISSNELRLFIDATFYNGTTYIDIANPSHEIQLHGYISRVPAEKKWLWLVESLANDNKLHFEWFPEGTIIKIIDSSGNIIREFTITGEHAGNTTQVLDYAISLPVTTLPDVTIEAYVPAQEIRVYGPPGAMVEIASDGIVYGAKEIPYYGYVDLNLTEPLDNAYIIVYADDKDENLNIDLKDLGGGKYKVTVSNDKGVVLPNMLVIVRDPSNAVVGYGVTDDSGTTTIDVGHPLPSITVEVHGIFDDKLYEATKQFTLATTENAEISNVQTSEQSSLTKYAIAGLGAIIMIIAVVIAITRRR